jgi:hypothetical protein
MIVCSMWQPYHPRIPWLFWTHHPRGGYLVEDRRTNRRVWARNAAALHQFAADHSSRGRGLGDLVHAVASALGFRRCDSCAERQARLNAWTNQRYGPGTWPY